MFDLLTHLKSCSLPPPDLHVSLDSFFCRSEDSAMGKLQALTSCLLLTVATVTAQTARVGGDRPLPQWLTGIIAVSIFLFLAFVGFLVKRAWCEKPDRSAAAVTQNQLVTTNQTGFETADETIYENAYDTTLDPARKKTSTKSRTKEDIYETTLDLVRSSEDAHAYNNLAIDSSADKVTSM